MNATEIAAKVRSGELKMRDVAEQSLARATQVNSGLNALVHLDADDVLAQAAAQERRLNSGASLSLAGVPVVIKDNICVRGTPTTCASNILRGFRPPYDAHVVERLRDAGAILFAKANCDEFGMGSSNESSAFGPTRNPWDPSRVPGGSSGGSAAAVAAGIAPLSLGSDTGGSVRQPAGFCGVVGLKPTYGRVSRYGLVAYGSSLDTIGPIARTADDAALILDVISGHDARDSTSLPSSRLVVEEGLAGVRIGMPSEWFAEGIEPDVRKAVDDALAVLRGLGATVREVSLPSIGYSLPTYYLLATAEASANLARYDGVKYGARVEERGASLKDMYRRTRSAGFGREVKQRIMLGTFALSSGYYEAYYGKAVRARAIITRDFERAFEQVDLLVSPTSPTTAFKLGEKQDDPLSMYLQDIYTIALNLVGAPGLSLPCGFDRAGLPIGLQLVAPRLGEGRLLGVAQAYQRNTKWHERRP
jgi:aspartyl-tRNA(Asn)/glutamyl-tRNA(Gln) amidotransferase subunit A